MRWIAFNTGLLSRSITDTGMLWKVWSECIHITGRLVQCLLSAWGLPGWFAILIISISGRFGRNRKRQKVCGRWSNACQGKNMTEPEKERSCSFLMRFWRMDRKAVHENFYNEANKRCRRKKWKSCWPSCWEWSLPWICCCCSVSLESVAHQGGRSIRSQMAWWTSFIGSGMAGMPKHLYYDFREMDSLPVHLFLYTGIVQKKQKHFWISMKRQNSTQRIAVPVALCYNETRRRTNRA